MAKKKCDNILLNEPISGLKVGKTINGVHHEFAFSSKSIRKAPPSRVCLVYGYTWHDFGNLYDTKRCEVNFKPT